MDIVLGAYLILAFTAFNKPDEKSKMCTKVNINIQDESTNGFINAKEIKTDWKNSTNTHCRKDD